MNVKFNLAFKFGCLSMATLIALGARYGHAGRLDADSTALFNKAQLYHLANNLGIFSFVLLGNNQTKKVAKFGLAGFIGGLALFCVPLYIMAVNGRSETMKYMMPMGGMFMLGGWMSLIFV